jgi:hypothetical protein
VDAFTERISVLEERRAEVAARRDAVVAKRNALIHDGKPTDGLWQELQGHESELHALDLELNDVRNIASDRWAGDRLRLDREAFEQGNKTLQAKRRALATVRDQAVKAVNDAAERFRDAVHDLDAMEKVQAAKAVELTATAAALGEPLTFTVPPEQVDRGPADATGYSRPSRADFANAKLMSAARAGNQAVLLAALAEAAATIQ